MPIQCCKVSEEVTEKVSEVIEETTAFKVFPEILRDILMKFSVSKTISHTDKVGLFRKICPVNMYQQGKYS